MFVACRSGHNIILPDGVHSRLRYKWKLLGDGSGNKVLQTQWRLANRDFQVPPEHELQPAVDRVVDYFSEPNLLIDWTEDARSLYLAYQAACNIRSHQAREESDTSAGARHGIAPWLLGDLAAILLIWDLFIGRIHRDRTRNLDLVGKTLKVEEEHVERAHYFLRVSEAIKEEVHAGSAAGTPVMSASHLPYVAPSSSLQSADQGGVREDTAIAGGEASFASEPARDDRIGVDAPALSEAQGSGLPVYV